MQYPATEKYKVSNARMLHAVIFVLAMMSFTLHSANARAAAWAPSEYRSVFAGHKFNDTWQHSVAFRLRPPRRLRMRHLELAVGVLSTTGETRPFVSVGPVWRLPLESQTMFVEFGFSPTVIAGSNLDGRDLGGNLHFTSSAAVGANFGEFRNMSLSLRIQHISNGGLSSKNPGMDMIGLNFSFNLNK